MGKIMKNGVEYGGAPLPIASQNTLGAIKVGNNLSIDPDGTLNAAGGGGGATALNDLTDVENIQPEQNEILMFDEDIEKYVNTMMTLNKISGVRVSYGTLADGDVLTYDSQSGRFVNKPASGGGGGVAYSSDYELKTYPADEPFKKYIRFTVPGNYGDISLMQKLVLAVQSTPYYALQDGSYREIVFSYNKCGIMGGGGNINFPETFKAKDSQNNIYEMGLQLTLSNLTYDNVNNVTYFDFDIDNTDVVDTTNSITYPINHQGLNLGVYASHLTVIG